MRGYRVYFCNDQGQMVAPAKLVSAVDDDDAIRQATTLVDDFNVELWDKSRLVKTLSHKE